MARWHRSRWPIRTALNGARDGTNIGEGVPAGVGGVNAAIERRCAHGRSSSLPFPLPDRNAAVMRKLARQHVGNICACVRGAATGAEILIPRYFEGPIPWRMAKIPAWR